MEASGPFFDGFKGFAAHGHPGFVCLQARGLSPQSMGATRAGAVVAGAQPASVGSSQASPRALNGYKLPAIDG
jgi:hypothetical protein